MIDGELKAVLEVVDVAEEEAVIWCLWRCGTMCCSGGVNDVAWDASVSQDHLHRPGGSIETVYLDAVTWNYVVY
jgi:hypothetical protein